MAKPESTDKVIEQIANLVSEGKLPHHRGRLLTEAVKVSKGRRVNKRKTAVRDDVIGGFISQQDVVKN